MKFTEPKYKIGDTVVFKIEFGEKEYYRQGIIIGADFYRKEIEADEKEIPSHWTYFVEFYALNKDDEKMSIVMEDHIGTKLN